MISRYSHFSFSRNIGVIRLFKAKLSELNVKRAKLSARRRDRIQLPNYNNTGGSKKTYHISEFLSNPSGIEAILNTSALESFQSLDSNTYRLTSSLPLCASWLTGCLIFPVILWNYSYFSFCNYHFTILFTWTCISAWILDV